MILEIYINVHANSILIFGDVNCHIGKENDFIENLDAIKPRKSIFMVKITYDDSFIDFLKDMKFCIVNGDT